MREGTRIPQKARLAIGGLALLTLATGGMIRGAEPPPATVDPPEAAGRTNQESAGRGDGGIEGTWVLESLELAGQKLAGFEGSRLVTAGGSKTFTTTDGRVEKGSYRIDPNKRPRWIDTTTAGKPENGRGIYRIKRNRLTICLCPSGAFRPTEFATRENVELMLLVFRRDEKRDDKRDAQRARAEAAAKGDRLLGLGVNEGSIGFEKAFRAARQTGIQFIELSQQWDDIEPKPGRFTNVYLDVANVYYSATKTGLVITFNPIDTTALRVPADLQGKPFDDPEVISRYNKAVDYVLSRLPDVDLVAFAIGNEIDGYLGADARKWAQYARFFEAAGRHVRRKRPKVPVGAKAMLPGLIGYAKSEMLTVNRHSDVTMATYYPLGDGFRVKHPSVVRNDVKTLIDLYKGKPVYLLEAGYPSSEVLGSSEAKQAQFIREMFETWDTHRSQLKLVNFIWLHDISAAEVTSYTKYYGLSSRGFAEYLGTLGLRTHDGRDKQAFQALREAAKARGW